jgi:DNA repair protein RadC
MELFLFRSIPRRDTKPVAKALIGAFGSFAAALAAPAHRLKAIDGVGDAVVSDFRLVRAAAERFAQESLAERDTLTSTDAVVTYYRTKLRAAEREEFHVLYLDKKNRYLASERAQVGTVDHTPVYPREVLKRAIEHGASAIVLVHNHPSGDPTPSRADVTMTKKIVEATAAVGITVHDHLVIGRNDHTSLRAHGLM